MGGLLRSGALGISPFGLFTGDTLAALACFTRDSNAPCGILVRSANEILQASLDLEQLTQPLIDLIGLLDRKLRHDRLLGYLEYNVTPEIRAVTWRYATNSCHKVVIRYISIQSGRSRTRRTMNNGASSSPANQADHILSAIVDASDDAIIITNLDGVILTWNRGAERLYGYTTSEITGRSIALLVPDGEVDHLTAVLDQIKAGKPVAERETVRQTKDGRLVEISLSRLPVRDETGRVVGVVNIARDLGAQKRAELGQETSEMRWRAVIESAVDGIVVIDAKGRIEAFNPAAERLFGYEEREVLGRNVNVLMPQPYRHEHDGYLAKYLKTGTAKIIGIGREVSGLRRDGTVFPLHLSVGEMSIGGERKFTGILHDLSARVRMEEQLREQAAMVHLGEMAALIAHEIKNPLAGIRGAVQVIGSRLASDSRDAAVAQEIVKRIDGLDHLMKDLLLFARPPQPTPAAVNVSELVSVTADLLARDPSIADVRVQVEGTAPPIMADSNLLKIVFVNLLVNGAHAMKGQGVIRVSVDATADACRIVFRDSGPGIPEPIRQRIFTPFFTTKSKGTGLGLPTAKRLIEAHKGRIEIDCPPKGGTVVTVQLPAQLPALA